MLMLNCPVMLNLIVPLFYILQISRNLDGLSCMISLQYLLGSEIVINWSSSAALNMLKMCFSRLELVFSALFHYGKLQGAARMIKIIK